MVVKQVQKAVNMNEKTLLKTNLYSNIFKLLLLMVLVFFAAKIRFELGAGWLVDTIFISFCILTAFSYAISYTANFKVDNQELIITVYRNLLGFKLIRVKVSSGFTKSIFTTAKKNTLTGLVEKGNIVIEGLDQDNICVTFEPI